MREAKNPPRDEEESRIILKAACGFLCRYIVADTPLLRHADAVVAIPPDPERYARRGMSLPDNLAMAVERPLAIPWPMEALVRTKSVELRELSWPETPPGDQRVDDSARRHAGEGAMRAARG